MILSRSLQLDSTEHISKYCEMNAIIIPGKKKFTSGEGGGGEGLFYILRAYSVALKKWQF